MRIKNLPFKIHYWVIDISSGVFKSLDDALLFLDALRIKILRLCNKKNCNCLFYGVVSISEKDTVQRTRYGSQLIQVECEKIPHIHCILISEKQSALEHSIAKYLGKTKAIKNYVTQNPQEQGYQIDTIEEHSDLSNRLLYRVSQGYVFRTADTCNKEFAQKYLGDFVNLVESKEKAMGGSTLVFPQYANMELGTDESVFDFTYNRKAKKCHLQNAEVFTNSQPQETFDSVVETYEKTCVSDEKGSIFGEITPKSNIFCVYDYCSDCTKTDNKKCNENNNI